MGSLDIVFLQNELEDALLAVKRSIRQIQTKVSVTLDNSEMTIFIILFNFGFERIAKIILLLKQHMESSKYPNIQWFLKNYRTHDVKLLLDIIKNELITKLFLSSNISARKDYNYIFKDKRNISNMLFDYCSYMSYANKGRYDNLNSILESTFRTKKNELIDELYDYIMLSHDSDWEVNQMKEIKDTSKLNEERLLNNPHTSQQPSRPYHNKMNEWMRNDLTIIIERLLRMLSFLFQKAYLGGISQSLMAGTDLSIFRCKTDAELGTTKY
jgi:hypothetical protein